MRITVIGDFNKGIFLILPEDLFRLLIPGHLCPDQENINRYAVSSCQRIQEPAIHHRPIIKSEINGYLLHRLYCRRRNWIKIICRPRKGSTGK